MAAESEPVTLSEIGIELRDKILRCIAEMDAKYPERVDETWEQFTLFCDEVRTPGDNEPVVVPEF